MKRWLIVVGAFVAVTWIAAAWSRRNRVTSTPTDSLIDLVLMQGRLNRSAFWLQISSAIALFRLAQAIQPAAASRGAIAFIAVAAALCALLLLTGALARRLRDVNLSGAWALALLAATIGLSFIGGATDSPAPIVAGAILFPGTILVIGITCGTAGKNRFGADPLATLCRPDAGFSWWGLSSSRPSRPRLFGPPIRWEGQTGDACARPRYHRMQRRSKSFDAANSGDLTMKKLIARALLAVALVAGTAAALTVQLQPALADCTGGQC